MSKLIRLTMILTALTTAADGFAAEGAKHSPHDPGVKARQHHQAERIKQGVRSGELTKDEAQQLKHEHRDIRKEAHDYKADGKLTPAERKDLHQDQNQLSKDIHEQKHDAEKR